MRKIEASVLNYFRHAQPIILIGMHRSGTSIMTRLLIGCKIFMGNHLSVNAESVFFRRLNEKIFRKTGSEWSRIKPLTKIMDSDEFLARNSDELRQRLFEKGEIRQFFGSNIWQIVYRQRLPLWGWKDPRTTITYPIWLDIFPKARIIHIIRNGIDVAISVHRRAKLHSQWWKRLLRSYNFSARMFNFAACFKLWEEYVIFALDHKNLIMNDYYLQVRFEELLENPERKLAQILDFAAVKIEEDILRKVCKQINRSRLDNSRFIAEYQQEIESLPDSALLRQLGY